MTDLVVGMVGMFQANYVGYVMIMVDIKIPTNPTNPTALTIPGGLHE